MNQCADQSSTYQQIYDIHIFVVHYIVYDIENIFYCTKSQSDQYTEKN